MKKGSGEPKPLSLCAPGSSGGCFNFLACDLLFGAEPVVQLVTVLPTACLVELLRA